MVSLNHTCIWHTLDIDLISINYAIENKIWITSFEVNYMPNFI